MSGSQPPNSPLPRWYGMDSDVYRTLAGKNSTRNAAIGPYTIVTKITWIQTRIASTRMVGLAPVIFPRGVIHDVRIGNHCRINRHVRDRGEGAATQNDRLAPDPI